MADFYRDEELDRLVRELNRENAAGVEPAPLRTGDVKEGDPLSSSLTEMVSRGASDLIVLPGMSPVLRVHGELAPTVLPALEESQIHSIVTAHAPARALAMLESDGACDFSIALESGASAAARRWRFRVNVHRQRGKLAASIRALPADIPNLEKLRLPKVLGELTQSTRGLVLVCGPTGAGKSTTIASLIDGINRRSAKHIVTIEDPIEYEHRNERSIVEQIEIGRDAPTFHTALRSALRQDPDVIMVGEMRDLETVATALQAAETGHLILATLHTSDVAQAVHRIVDVFPASQQQQVRQQLALSLTAILCQQLVPRADGAGRIAAVELLIANYAIRHHIRGDKLQQLSTELTLGKKAGMITMEDSLSTLVRDGTVTPEEAQIRMRHAGDLQAYLS